jgi:hypothetical protein
LHEGGADPLNIQNNERSQGGGRYEVNFGVSCKLMRCTTSIVLSFDLVMGDL